MIQIHSDHLWNNYFYSSLFSDYFYFCIHTLRIHFSSKYIFYISRIVTYHDMVASFFEKLIWIFLKSHLIEFNSPQISNISKSRYDESPSTLQNYCSIADAENADLSRVVRSGSRIWYNMQLWWRVAWPWTKTTLDPGQRHAIVTN